MKADEAKVELSSWKASLPEDEEAPGVEDFVWGCDWGCGFVGTASVVRSHEQTCDQRRRDRELSSRTSKEIRASTLARGLGRGLSWDALPEQVSHATAFRRASLTSDSIPPVCYSRRSSLYSVPPLLPSLLEAASTTQQHPRHTRREQQLDAEVQTAAGTATTSATSAKNSRRRSVV